MLPASLQTEMGLNPVANRQSPGLALDNGTNPDGTPYSHLYIGFAAFADNGPYHGAVVLYDASTLTFLTAWNSTPAPTAASANLGQGGIWMSGAAPAVDTTSGTAGTGSDPVYLSTGNGEVPVAGQNPPSNFAMSVVGLQFKGGDFNTLGPSNFFAPHNASALGGCTVVTTTYEGQTATYTYGCADGDLAAGGVALFTSMSPHIVVAGGKESVLYALSTANLGGIVSGNTDTQCIGGSSTYVGSETGPNDLKQEIHSIVGWDVPNSPQVFVWPTGTTLQRLTFSPTQKPKLAMSSPTSVPAGVPDIMMTLSSSDSTHGLLWASMVTGGSPNHTTTHGMLTAFNANTLGPVWSTAKFAGIGANNLRDDVGPHAKFNPPMIANGSVYEGTFEGIVTDDGGPSMQTGFTSNYHPAIIGGINDDFITMAFTGKDGHVDIATTSDGFNYPPVEETGYTAADGPSITLASNGVAYIGYRGTDGNHTPQLFASADRTFTNTSLYRTHAFSGEKANYGPTVLFQPAFGSNPALIWYFWVGSDNKINWETSSVTADGTTSFGNKETISETASNPIGAVFDPIGNQVRIAWTGTDSNLSVSVAALSAFNSNSYTKQVFNVSSIGKVTISRNGFLIVGYSDANNIINYFTADPGTSNITTDSNNNPYDLTVYTEKTSVDGYDLATFHGRTYIAWTGVAGSTDNGTTNNNNILLSVLNPGSLVAYSRPPSLPPPTGILTAIKENGATTSEFGVGADGTLYARGFSSGGTEQPVALSAPSFAPPGAGVVVADKTSTESDGFVVANDGALYMTSETSGGSWQALTALTSTSFAAPGAQLTTATSAGQLGVFVVNSSGTLEVVWWNPTLGWLGPVAIGSAGFAPSGAPLASGTRSNGELDIYAVGTNGNLEYMAFNGVTWSGPISLSVNSFAPPGAPVAAALDIHGFMNVFTIGTTGGLYTKWDQTALWAGPTLIGTTGTFPPGANLSAVNYNAALDVFAVDSTGAIDWFTNNGGSWGGPTALAPAGSATPGAATSEALQGTTQLNLFAVGVGGLLESVNTGSGWSALTPQP